MGEEGKRERLSQTLQRPACDAFLGSALLTVFRSKCRFATQAFGTTRFNFVLAGRRMAAGWVPNGCRFERAGRRFEATNRRFGTDWGRNRPAGRVRSWTSQPLHVGQAQEQRRTVAILAVVEKLVNALVAATGAVHEHVFQLHEPAKLTPERSVAPAQRFTHLTLGETHVGTRHALGLTSLRDILVELGQQLPGLGQERIAACARALRRPGSWPVRRSSAVATTHAWARSPCPTRDALTLVLVQQRQRGDQGQVLGMVPPHPRLVGAKVNCSAQGMTTPSGSSSRWACWWRRRTAWPSAAIPFSV